MSNNQLTLAIETSCDETSVAVLRGETELLVNLIASQVEAHQLFGGVVPEIASRKHLELLNPLLATAQKEVGFDWSELGLVAVTHGPGLVGALLVGVAAAKALAFAHTIPIQPVNHIEGHIYSNFLARPDLSFPMLTLIVSGGHSDLVLMRGHGQFERLGRTRDDAVGEAFDKVARALGLSMPGGPALEKASLAGNERAFRFGISNLEPSLDFSFSGLKTAGAQAIRKHPDQVADVAASFQFAAVSQLRGTVARALIFCKERGDDVRTLGLCGGVAANSAVRASLQELSQASGLDFVAPASVLCTDNAAMIAAAGHYRWLQRSDEDQRYTLSSLEFEAHSLLPVA
jgi:N6-L-threonylcarbamoyladenine synthase